MQVKEIMTADPKGVQVDDTFESVLHLLNTLDVRHIPVLDAGVLVGMISDRDLRGLTSSQHRPDDVERAEALLNTPVTAFMHAELVHVTPETPLRELIALMIDHKYGAIPVCDASWRLVGIVSYIDLLQLTLRQLDA